MRKPEPTNEDEEAEKLMAELQNEKN